MDAGRKARVTLEDWLCFRYWINRGTYYDYIPTFIDLWRYLEDPSIEIVRADVREINAGKEIFKPKGVTM
jgi:hypothetical protein